MVYSRVDFEDESLKAANIFAGSTTFVLTQLAPFFIYFPPFFMSYFFLRSRLYWGPVFFIWINERHPRSSWTIHCILAYWGVFGTNLIAFETDYAQAWRDRLQNEGGALDLDFRRQRCGIGSYTVQHGGWRERHSG